MDSEWKLVYTSPEAYKIEILKGRLESEDIEAVSISKKDSAYLFGEIELYVRAEDVLKAKKILISFETP
ncbi:MAG: DUF2007 domain-containing protein [Bacteroidales bacterium]|nr:DUF2007 domain-containing protein [Bacteroidales bacterium]